MEQNLNNSNVTDTLDFVSEDPIVSNSSKEFLYLFVLKRGNIALDMLEKRILQDPDWLRPPLTF